MENGKMKDVIYFEDGDRTRKKEGKIEKIEKGLVYFLEHPSNEHMMIPVTRCIRIVKGGR